MMIHPTTTTTTTTMAPVVAAYDPYNSPIDDGREDDTVVCDVDGDEPRVLLFPLSYSANALESSSLPREIRVAPTQPLSHFPRSQQPVEATSNAEIEALKRRLEHIKQRRARQRERTMALQRKNEQKEQGEASPKRALPRHPSTTETPPLQPEHESSRVISKGATAAPLQSQQTSTIRRRRPSISSQTVGETIDTTLESSTNTSLLLHPRRLLCSSNKAKDQAAQRRKEERSRSQPTATLLDQRQRQRQQHEGEVSTNVLESLVCLRSNEKDQLDLIFCSERPREEMNDTDRSPRAPEEKFDPYQSRADLVPRAGNPNSEEPSCLSWEDRIPRGRSYSVEGDGQKGSSLSSSILDDHMGVAPSKSCMPQRSPAWYERSSAEGTRNIDMDSSSSGGAARVMEMVFYLDRPMDQAFDTHAQLGHQMI